jgi:D-alanine-D-alanine ligase
MSLVGKKIGILCGGQSEEREVSLKSGQTIYQALKDEGLDVVKMDVDQAVLKKIERKKIDVAVLALHGGWGEDGTIQAVCKLMGIPFTGPDVLGSALALNKVMAKKIFKSEGIPTPPWKVISQDETTKGGYLDKLTQKLGDEFGLPVVLKPVLQGSSVGLKVVKEKTNLKSSIKESMKYGKCLLVEKYLRGTEVTVGILGQGHDLEPLPVVEIVPQRGVYDFKSKYTPGQTQYIVPARLPKKLYEKTQLLALQAFKALNLDIVARIDMLIEEDRNLYVLEANTNPGMTATSLLPKAALAAGYEFPKLLRRMIELAIKRATQ